jgi:hypothetical protein
MRNTLFILLTCISMTACGGGGGGNDTSVAEQAATINASQAKADIIIFTQAQILASPFTSLINSKSLSAKSTAYLNQMPRVVGSAANTNPCNTPTLIVPIEISSEPAVSLADVTVDTVFVAADGKWWESPVNPANTVEQIGKKLVVASGCPSVGFKANDKIQVVVKVSQGSQSAYIRAPEQVLPSVE